MNVEEFKNSAGAIYSEIMANFKTDKPNVCSAADVFYYLADATYARYCGVGQNAKEREKLINVLRDDYSMDGFTDKAKQDLATFRLQYRDELSQELSLGL